MKSLRILSFTAVLFIILSACGSEPTTSTTSPTTDVAVAPESPQPQTDPKGEMFMGSGPGYAFQQSQEYIEFWGEAKAVPTLDLNQDLTQMPLAEIRLLRQTVMARKGYLFEDEQVRSHFLGTNWYQPWWKNNFQPVYDAEEKAFIEKALKVESQLQKGKFPEKGGVIRPDRIANLVHFSKDVTPDIEPILAQQAVAIRPAQHEQLFHLYDRNNYESVPTFVTTDLYLQLLHIYFSRILQELETEKFSPVVENLCLRLYQENAADIANIEDATWKAAAEYNQMFYGMAYELLTGKRLSIPASMQEAYETELGKIQAASGQGSQLLKSEFFDFSLFKPRGHYTRTPALTAYFKAMMWLQTPPFYRENAVAFDAAMVTATHFLESPDIFKLYQTLSEPVAFLVGAPNRYSLQHLFEVMQAEGMPADPLAFFSSEYETQIAEKLQSIVLTRFKNKGANADTQDELDKLAVYFLPQRYTLDAEILIRLVDVERDELSQQPKRAFPKGLDVFAALGNPTAEDILLRKIKENEAWPAYGDSLKAVQQKFSNYANWNENGYSRWINMLREMLLYDAEQPFFMQTRGWRLKNLNTALASWAELKHNTLLYAEQPMAAQMGSGGEDMPEAYLEGFVEPNIRFWNRAISLVETIEQKLRSYDLLTDNMRQKSEGLLEMGNRLRKIVRQELKDQPLSPADKDYLRFIGGDAEWLTLRLLDKENIQWYEVNATDKFMAVVADVYTYQGEQSENRGVLEEGVGFADELYVAVELPNGDLTLMRGAVFSYYEFRQPINERLTDEEWQKMLQEERAPERPSWMQEVLTKK